MKYYNKIAKSYNRLHRQEQLEKVKIIIKKILPLIKKQSAKKHLPKANLLDIGAGTGISTKPFTKYFKCTALDPSEKLLKQIKSKKIKKILAKAESLPFKKNSFDIIISITALHHANLKKAIREINRVAKKHAVIVISFLKKSKKLKQAKKLLKDYKKINSQKDIIFINQKHKTKT